MSVDQGVAQTLGRSLAFRIGIALVVLLAVAVVAATMLGGPQVEKNSIPAAVATAQAPLPEAQPKAVEAAVLQGEPLPAAAPSGTESASAECKLGAQTTPAPADSALAAAVAALRSPPGAKPPRGPHLQAGVFLQPSNAQSFKVNLEAQGLPVYIESRVHIGPFRDRKEAERAREQLREAGVSTVLIAQ